MQCELLQFRRVKILIRDFSDRDRFRQRRFRILAWEGRLVSKWSAVIPAFMEERETRDDLVDGFMEWRIARRGNEDK